MSESTIIAPWTPKPLAPFDFENPIWQTCPSISITRLWSGEPAAPSRYAEARLCWSNEALHVRFVCIQTEALVVSTDPITSKKTLGLWDRDVCEIFLAPDPLNPWRYFEFEAAPTGEWIDLGITITPSGRETDWDFDSGLSTDAKVEGEKLFLGMKIPWSEAIPKPESGDVWRVNVFRCAGPEAQSRYLAWRPTRTPEPNFHVAEAFGYLRFG